MEKVSVDEFKKYSNDYLEDAKLEIGRLKDECTIVAMEIR